MKVYELHAEQWLPVKIEDAWTFFSSAKNLATITPGNLGFHITSTDLPPDIFTGMLIKYRLKPLFGIPVKWTTEITAVDRPHSFIDKQLKGPYSLWEHQHRFIEKDGGVLVLDRVRYSLPFGVLGRIMQKLVVKKKLDNIFLFRRETLSHLFK